MFVRVCLLNPLTIVLVLALKLLSSCAETIPDGLCFVKVALLGRRGNMRKRRERVGFPFFTSDFRK